MLHFIKLHEIEKSKPTLQAEIFDKIANEELAAHILNHTCEPRDIMHSGFLEALRQPSQEVVEQVMAGVCLQ